MKDTSRKITGIIIFLFGIFFTTISFFGEYYFLIYGIPGLVLGVVIFFNKKEDSIEEIKSRKNKTIE